METVSKTKTRSKQLGFIALGALAPLLPVLPWLLLGVGLIAAGAFWYGLSIGNDRLESYQHAQQEVQKAHEQWARSIGKARKTTTEKANARHKAKILAQDRLYSAELERMRAERDKAREELLPAPSRPAGSGTGVGNGAGEDRVCFRRDQLNKGMGDALRQFDESITRGAAQILQRGDRARAAFETCAAWAIEQQQIK